MSAEDQGKLHAQARGKAMEAAIGHGEVKAVRALLKEGIDVNACYALHLAASEDSLTIVKLLIEHGADVDLQDGRGFTALHYASEMQHEKICRLLVKAGALVNVTANDGNTPLHMAVRQSAFTIARFLIRHGAHVDAVSEHGLTALHLAVNNDAGDTDIALIKQLLELGVPSSFVPADVAADGKYLTPFQSALESWNDEAARIMFDLGGENPHQITLDGRSMDELVESNSEMKQFLHILRTEWAVNSNMECGGDALTVRRKPATALSPL